jgi:hypothetical protein
MKRPHRALVGIIFGLLASFIVAPQPAHAQAKAPAKKRPHSESRTPYVHRIQLRDDQDNPISIPKPDPAARDKAPEIKAPSLAFTCGKCHDYPTISSGWHSNAADPNVPPGRSGEPWILTDDGLREDLKGPGPSNTRTELPLSYRGWDGTWKPSEIGFSDWDFAYAFGRQLPGGGILESSKDIRFNVTGHLQNDCLVCHIADNNYDGNARYEQIVKKQNFKWAPVVAAGVGLAEKSRERLKDTWVAGEGPKEPTFDYDLHRFNDEGHILFNVTRRIPNERCYFCHTSLATDKSQSGGLSQIWRHDRDIHLIKGMLCVDCHRNGLDHAITRGYEKESEDRKDTHLASLTCQGCHYGAGDHATGSDLGGRNAAPRPVHKGLPTLHFDKLSCTACHSGPYPGDQAKEMLTSMAHRLGTESFNRTDQAAPTLQAPVFLRNPRTGKITPNKVLYPTFWGRLNGDDITPITPDLLNTSAALRKIFGPKPTLDGQPAKPLTEDQIVKALDAVALMKPVAPKTAQATTKPTTTTASAPATPAWYTGEPVFVTGGKAYKRGGNGKLTSFTNKDAEPYTWEFAHDVRGAQQALGARGCTDCHASGAPIFDSKVSTAALFSGASTSIPMHELRNDAMGSFTAFATTYPLRPILIATGYICAIILLLVLIAYGSRGVIGIARRSARKI